MERAGERQVLSQAEFAQARGSERFSWKNAIKGGLLLGALGFFAGISLVLAVSNLETINLLSNSVAPLVLGAGFGGLGFIGGGILGRTLK